MQADRIETNHAVVILDCILDAAEPISSYKLLKQLQEKGTPISVALIVHHLNRLVELRLLKKVNGKDNPKHARYAPLFNRHPEGRVTNWTRVGSLAIRQTNEFFLINGKKNPAMLLVPPQ